MDGKAVQLRRGKDHVLTSDRSPIELAIEFNRYGEVAVIDLDAALGNGDNRELIKQICRVADVRAGGGVRDESVARDFLRAGARKVIIGTKAEPELLSKLPPERVMVALDQVDGKVVDDGWRSSTGESVLERAQRLSPYCSGFLSTFVQKEGCMEGMDKEVVAALRDNLPRPLTVAGGIADTAEVLSLADAGVDIQVGMALYTGKIDLNEAFIGSLKFDKGLIPTIVQNQLGDVLMVAYSSRESLQKALTEGSGTYFSRSRQSVWKKGETSGNTQRLISCRADCDRDSIVFRVEQSGVACHNGSYTCFDRNETRQFDVSELFGVIKNRKKTELEAQGNGQQKPSYTRELLTDRRKLLKKIMEEAYEVSTFSSKENLKWEIADLLYFVSVLAVDEGIEWSDIQAELGGRCR
jgi:phosphoribosyl-ATP pyrophosphohydrolase